MKRRYLKMDEFYDVRASRTEAAELQPMAAE